MAYGKCIFLHLIKSISYLSCFLLKTEHFNVDVHRLHLKIILTFLFFSEYASLSTGGLIAKVKELHDVAYQLGVEEGKEMTRGKYLNLFKRTNSRVG